MAVILPPVCSHCGPPEHWRRGLVFHPAHIHYKEVSPAADKEHWRMLATIVERTYVSPVCQTPASRRQRQCVVIEVA